LKHIVDVFGKDAVIWFQLDNEPGLWHATHRDVHPNPLTYDELWAKTVAYSVAIKTAFPNAKIFGPISWGWCAYMFSPADGNCKDGADRQAHDDLPLIEWYIQQIARYKFSTGIQLIDYIDFHYYPASANVAFGPVEDLVTTTLRLRSTRSLYDPDYVDESWVSEAIYIIPRVRNWINQYTPGLKIAISEYNWGWDEIITGAVAQAEVLAIFAREQVDVSARWVVPELGSVVEDAYKIFLNYDGHGAKISGDSVGANTTSIDEVTGYAFDDTTTKTLYVLLISKIPAGQIPVTVDVSSVSLSGSATIYAFDPKNRLHLAGTANVGNGKLQVTLGYWSATLVVAKYT